MILRFFWPLMAAGITVVLFLIMSQLIIPQSQVPQTVDKDVSIQITRTKRKEHTQERTRLTPEPPEQHKTPPPPALAPPRPSMNNQAVVVEPTIPLTNDNGKGLLLSTDRRATPLVRFPPEYPPRPAEKGQEGWVLVEFTITHTGEVEDLVVVDAEPKKVFNRSVLRALKRWKYQPKIVNGKAVPQYNMREIIRFELDKS